MNALIFTGIFSNGGAEKNALNFALALKESGYSVTLVITRNQSIISNTKISENFGISVIDFNSRKTIYTFFNSLFLLKNSKNFFLFVFSPEAQTLIGLISIFITIKGKIITRNINTLSKIFSLSNLNKTYFFFYSYILRRVYDISALILNQSRGMHEDFIKLFPSYRNSSRILYNALSKEKEHSQKINLTDRNNFIICAGRLTYQKRFDHAIKAFKLISDRVHYDLYIFGDGEERKTLEELVLNLGISSRVKFFGNVSNLSDYLVKARVLILTSRYEGFPNIILESLKFGTPVVSYDCESGPSELIFNGLNGYLVPNSDIKQLANQILTALIFDWNYYNISKTVDKYRFESFKESLNKLLINI